MWAIGVRRQRGPHRLRLHGRDQLRRIHRCILPQFDTSSTPSRWPTGTERHLWHRQLLLTLRERALRAEETQRLHADRIRLAKRTRIAREMHDVLGHRISLLALHAGALALQPDLPPENVRETAELMRSTARKHWRSCGP